MSSNSYLDFDLLIESSGENFRAAVVDSPAGQASNTFSLPFSQKDLEILVLQVFRLTSRRSVRAIGAPEMKDVRSFGGHLYEALFAGPISTCLLRSMDEAERTHRGLRVRLRLGSAPALANIPWEFLYDSASDGFLCLSDETPVVRYMDLPQRVEPLTAKAPLRMLCLISSPAGYPPLDVEREWAKLEEALGPTVQEGRLLIERVETPSLEALQRRLRRNDYHILHFVGHGAFDEQAQDGVLLLEDLDGKGYPVSGESLGVLLHDHDSLRLVVLNACEGARTSSTDPFAGTAQSLIRKGIPAVIAMQFEISDVAAITLANEFYSAVADGYPVDGALCEARKAIFTRVNAVEWATPVLYMRSPDGRIFEVEDQEERLATREMRRVLTEPAQPVAPLLSAPERTTPSAPERMTPSTPAPIVQPSPALLQEPPIVLPEPAIVLPEPATRPPGPPPKKQRPDPIKKLALLAGALVLVAAAIFLIRALVGGGEPDGSGGGGGAVIVVPDVSGRGGDRASNDLGALGLNVERVDRPSRTVSEGLVVSTIPAADTEARQGSKILLIVSAGEWIAYVTDRDESDPSSCDPCNSEIYLVRPDGSSDPVNATNNQASDNSPAWSPDGSRLAFVSNRDDPNPRSCGHSCNYEIYILNPDETVTRVTNSPWNDGSPTWSPDGKRIAFHSNREAPDRGSCDASDKCDFDIFVVNADGTGLKRLTESKASDESPRWSPKANTIAFRSHRDGNYEIYSMNANGQRQRNLTKSHFDEAGPAWSPDGKRIAYRRIGGDGNFDIYVMNADGSGQGRLTDDPAREAQPTWSPDSTRIAFLYQPEGGQEDIAVMSADGGSPTILTGAEGNSTRPAW